jgi:hypothetical protein
LKREYTQGKARRIFSMFESLDERIKIDESGESTPKQRMIRYGIIGIVSLGVIVILYEAVHLLG